MIYYSPNVSGKEAAIKKVLQDFVQSHDEKTVHNAVVFVQANLPAGVNRVDGTVIEPLLISVLKGELTWTNRMQLVKKTLIQKISALFKRND